jgi:hypothetical protein
MNRSAFVGGLGAAFAEALFSEAQPWANQFVLRSMG